MDSSIINRINRFLHQTPPFYFLASADVEKLSQNVRIAVFKKQEKVFSKHTDTGNYFYVVKKGAVDIVEPIGESTTLIDKCGEGDIFGIRPILARSSYLFDATCAEDSIIYEIPITLFKEIYHQNAKAADYMLQRFAAGRTMTESLNDRTIPSAILPSSLVIRPSIDRQLITATPDKTIQEAIQKMNEHEVSSIIIIGERKNPVGIITDRDIRSFVARGYQPNTSITEIMSQPVKCIPPEITLPEIQLEMVESGRHHLCITANGEDDSKCLGIVTEHDIIYTNASDPVVILKKIKKAKSSKVLIEARTKIDKILPVFLQEDINRKITLSLIDRLNRALIQKSVQLSLDMYNDANPDQVITKDMFAFLSMGSAARGEQLLMTDQDNALIIADKFFDRKACFLKLAKIITTTLHEIGYKYCPAQMMASHPDWCLTLKEIKKKASNWVLNPGPKEVMLTTIFFDFRYEYGSLSMAKELNKYIDHLLEKQDLYIRFLAGQAIKNPPPLSFFRNFIIEKDGEHKNLFDIKLRGIAPLMDIARVFALDQLSINSSNTCHRFAAMMEVDPANADLYKEAQDAFLELLACKLKVALKEKNDGRYINPDTLDKVQKISLRKCFKPVQKLLDMLEKKYNLSYFQ